MTAAFDPPATRGIEAPRAPRKRVSGRRSNFEMYSWMFMRPYPQVFRAKPGT